MSALQQRQSEIIKQLEQLRLKLNEMQSKLGVTETPAQQKKVQQKKAAPVIKPIDVSIKRSCQPDVDTLLLNLFSRFFPSLGKIPATIGHPCESGQYSILIFGATNIVDKPIEFSA